MRVLSIFVPIREQIRFIHIKFYQTVNQEGQFDNFRRVFYLVQLVLLIQCTKTKDLN